MFQWILPGMAADFICLSFSAYTLALPEYLRDTLRSVSLRKEMSGASLTMREALRRHMRKVLYGFSGRNDEVLLFRAARSAMWVMW